MWSLQVLTKYRVYRDQLEEVMAERKAKSTTSQLYEIFIDLGYSVVEDFRLCSELP